MEPDNAYPKILFEKEKLEIQGPTSCDLKVRCSMEAPRINPANDKLLINHPVPIRLNYDLNDNVASCLTLMENLL